MICGLYPEQLCSACGCPSISSHVRIFMGHDVAGCDELNVVWQRICKALLYGESGAGLVAVICLCSCSLGTSSV